VGTMSDYEVCLLRGKRVRAETISRYGGEKGKEQGRKKGRRRRERSDRLNESVYM